jgi:hypothetical protein
MERAVPQAMEREALPVPLREALRVPLREALRVQEPAGTPGAAAYRAWRAFSRWRG